MAWLELPEVLTTISGIKITKKHKKLIEQKKFIHKNQLYKEDPLQYQKTDCPSKSSESEFRFCFDELEYIPKKVFRVSYKYHTYHINSFIRTHEI